MKKSPITQELVNIFPPWARTRTCEQSIGYQFLNTLAQPMEKMQKSLLRAGANTHLATANLDEIDLIYKVTLPVDYEFDTNDNDNLSSVYLPPTVDGVLNSISYTIEAVDPNTIEAFWYDALPNRATLDDTVTGTDHSLLSFVASGISEIGEWDHHLDGGTIWVETVGGTRYLETTEDTLYRGRVVLTGINRQGIEDIETIIFPWDMKQHTVKDWRTITQVEARDMEDEVDIIISSANFNADDRLAPYNIRYSENRKKIDEYWGLGFIGTGSSLDRIGYTSDEWQQLIMGFITKESKERWELLGENYETVSGLDMVLQPFTDRAWMVTEDKHLYCYDIHGDTVSGIDYIDDRTVGSDIQIDLDTTSVLLGEDIIFTPWHVRPVKEIAEYRVWYQQPDGTKYGLLDGSPVAFSSDFWVRSQTLKRNISNLLSITTTQRGEYLLVTEAVFVDGEEQTEKVIVPVNYKLPLTVIDISDIIPESIVGLDFDSDAKLWISTADKYYQVGLHSDVMLIDYENKILYLHEEYDEVGVD